MSGHSKWSKIKRKKEANDQKKSKVQSKLIREITVAARDGADPDGNPRLRTAVASARGVNVPNDVIDKAILRGSGQLQGVVYEECVYEGYGPNGVALYIEVTTDNRNRSAADLRHLLGKYAGSLGEPNSVAWLFDKRGSILVPTGGVDEDDLMMAALEAGADDVVTDEGVYEVVTPPDAVHQVETALREAGYGIESVDTDFIPQSSVQVAARPASRLLELIDALEELDDVANVYSNFDVDDEVMAEFAESAA